MSKNKNVITMSDMDNDSGGVQPLSDAQRASAELVDFAHRWASALRAEGFEEQADDIEQFIISQEVLKENK